MLRVLIVDDEPLSLAHLHRLLTGQGVREIHEAETAAEALQLAEDSHPDLLMADIQMPGLDGMQLATALMQMEPAPLVVFVTGYSDYAI
jgi:YesN/AraC family two-component response regulator